METTTPNLSTENLAPVAAVKTPVKAEQFRCTVTEFNSLTPNVFELKFTTDKPMSFEAGQYISVLVPHGDEKPLRRPYSIASAPHVNPVELCVQQVEKGPGSNFLAGLRAGDTFEGVAPFGYLTYHPKPNRHAVFIATGTGIAPFRSMILSEDFANNRPLSTLFLLGVRSFEDLLYPKDFESMEGVKWVPCLSGPAEQAGHCFSGRVTRYLESLEETFPWMETDFYLCGNGAMIDDVRKFLKAKGVDRKSIHVEIYFRPEATN